MEQSPIQSTQNTLTAGADQAREEFTIAVADHRPHIFRFMLASLRDVDLAETLTQECFLRAYSNWHNFRGQSSRKTWLMRIAINLQKDHWRNRRMQFWRQVHGNAVDPDEVCSWLPSRESSPEEQVAAREQVAQVWKAVKRLTEKQQAVFLLRFVEELAYEEIACATGMHEGTVKATLFRALKRVREELNRKPQALRNSFAI